MYHDTWEYRSFYFNFLCISRGEATVLIHMNIMFKILFSLCFALTQTGRVNSKYMIPLREHYLFPRFLSSLSLLKKSWPRKLNLVFVVELLESLILCQASDRSYIVLSYWLRGAAKLCTINVMGRNLLTTIRNREL